jgi:hypothetical protein
MRFLPKVLTWQACEYRVLVVPFALLNSLDGGDNRPKGCRRHFCFSATKLRPQLSPVYPVETVSRRSVSHHGPAVFIE